MDEQSEYESKVKNLKMIISEILREDVMLAYSGGVDSSLLLKLACAAAKETGCKVFAVFLHTMLHPVSEIENARRIAEDTGAKFQIIQVDELASAGIEDNPVERCYLCKKHLFQILRKEAESQGVTVIMEGTNADDISAYRPGIKALQELGIQSPLAKAGMSKADVRKLAEFYGMDVSKKPATPCLATRFPYGTRLSYEEIKKVEKAEQYLRKLGFYNVRVRVHGEIVRIEVDSRDIGKLVEKKEEVIDYLKKLGYRYITVDLEGFRSGSMDR